MDNFTNDELKSIDKNSILVVDYGNSSKKVRPITDFPESMRSKPIKSDNDEKILKIPIKGIKIVPLDEEGKLVEASQAKIINVQYLDENGSVLESTTMQRE